MNRYILFFIISLAFAALNTQAQAPLKHKAKFYQAEDGKLYVQKETPLYFYISSEPNGKGNLHQLQSDSTKAFANPMYLDTEGYNTFKSPSAVDTNTLEIHYPLTDVIFEMFADSRSPKTKIKYNTKKKYYNGETLFVGSNLTIDLSSKDALSGVEQTLYSIDSIGYKKYNTPFKLEKEKLYDINYYSVDNVGNPEKVKHHSFHLDISTPNSSIEFKGNKYENIVSGKTKIIITAEDKISGVAKVFYSMDEKAYTTYKYALNTAYLSEGEHTIKYYAEDYVGNKEAEKNYTFFVDKTPPILVDEILGNSYMVNGKEYSSGRTKLKLTAVDNKAGIEEIKYSLNNEPYLLYEKPFYLTTVSGSLAVKSYAIDRVGNRSEASEKSTRSKAAYVDLTGPDLKYSFIGKYFKSRDVVFINKDTKIKLKASDGESGVKEINYSIDGGDENIYTEPFKLIEDGAKELSIFGYDNVDNSNRISVKLITDNTGPDIYSRFSVLPVGKKDIDGQSYDMYSSHVVLFLSATDAQVAIDRIYYAVDDEPEQMYTGIVDGFKRGKMYHLTIKAYDKLGNVNIDTVSFATDNTGPEVFTRFSIQSLGNAEYEGNKIDIYPTHASLFLSVTNAPIAYDKIYYSINGGKERLYQGIIDGFTAGSVVNMDIRAVDRLGNQTEKTTVFKISED